MCVVDMVLNNVVETRPHDSNLWAMRVAPDGETSIASFNNVAPQSSGSFEPYQVEMNQARHRLLESAEREQVFIHSSEQEQMVSLWGQNNLCRFNSIFIAISLVHLKFSGDP